MENNFKEKRIVTQILWNIIAVAVIFLIINLNFPISPQNKMHTRSNKVTFEWIGLSNAKIDDNPEFISPIEINKNNPVVELKPGMYYWKAGLSRVHGFVIDSEVGIAVTPSKIGNETAYRIENKGNTRILLNIIGMITGRAVLEPDAVTYEKNVSNIKEIEAEENG